MSNPVFTYQTRIAPTSDQAGLLDAYAELHGKAERSLFAAMQAGGAINDLKRAFQKRFGISARQFNAMRVELEGKIASIKALRPEQILESEARIAKAKKTIAKLEKQQPATATLRQKLHQKKRRLKRLQEQLAQRRADEEAGAVRLCFGSKKLFHAQFYLQENGFADRADWKAHWQQARSNQFFCLGSQDETAGNQSCQAHINAHGALDLQLRLPHVLADKGKHITFTGVRFAYGHEAIVAALNTSRRIQTTTRAGTPCSKRIGTAQSYRFLRDEKGWRLFVSVEAQPVEVVTRGALGAIGVDVNVDHLAVAQTDRFGNLIDAQRIALVTYGKTANQAKALIGDVAATLAEQARAAGKPIVVEELDFRKKKAALEGADPKQARLLSSFAYNATLSAIKAAAFRAGVEVVEVNPAFTSVIGAVNVAQEKGISVHQGAAYAIARRGSGLSERPTVRTVVAPTRNGGHVTFALPARNRAKHVWSFWSRVRKTLTAAHEAHFRCGEHHSNPPPLSPSKPRVSPIWESPVKSRRANRCSDCSGDVESDLPW